MLQDDWLQRYFRLWRVVVLIPTPSIACHSFKIATYHYGEQSGFPMSFDMRRRFTSSARMETEGLCQQWRLEKLWSWRLDGG
jgi:hypothetical protein